MTRSLFLLFCLLCVVPTGLAGGTEKPNVLFLITDDQRRDMMNWYPEGRGKNHVISTPGRKRPKWDADPTSRETKAFLEGNRQLQVTAASRAGFDYAASMYFNNPVENGIKQLAVHNLDWIAQGALDFIGHTGEKPFFLYLATTIPHGPVESERSWQADRRMTADGVLDKPLRLLSSKDELPKRLKEAKIRGRRKENLLWQDDLVGVVLDKLEERGQLDSTIIVYFNDHGQRSKGTVYEGGVHGESFIWRQGGFPVGSTSDVPVSNVDFAPTLLDLAGIAYGPDDFDGQSFAPVLMGQEATKRESLYFEIGYVRGVLKDGWKYIALRYPESATNMSREQRNKILKKFNEHQVRKGRPVHTLDPMEPFSHVMLIPGGGDAEHMAMGKYPGFYDSDQLYRLSDDPNEQRNLAKDPEHAAKLAEMRTELQKHLKGLPGTFGELMR